MKQCPVCDSTLSPDAHPNRKYCEDHKTRKSRSEAGWCNQCGACPSLDDRSTCKDCGEYMREYRENRKDNHSGWVIVPCDLCGEDLQTSKPDILLHAHSKCRREYLHKYLAEKNRYYRRNPDALEDLRERIMNGVL